MSGTVRLGLTMRVQRCVDSHELRDVLAHDWSALIRATLGGMSWLPIPNIEASAMDYLQRWRINGVILTGGEDVGASPLREETERHVLDYCIERRLPVLGVCRGHQMIQVYCGGDLRTVPSARHVGKPHPVFPCHDRSRALWGTGPLEVNSYHRQGVYQDRLGPGLQPWLVSSDGLVEGFCHDEKNLLGVQWHPERRLPDPGMARKLMRYCFARKSG